MNQASRLFPALILTLLASFVFAQTEICDNGIDDDGDGFIDCYDGECASDGACDDFFFGNVVECADDIDVTSFAIRLQWGSEDRSSNSHATPMVGDLDGNGIPEVVATNKQRRSVFILNGANGETLFSNTSLGFQPENVPVLGDIDRDEFGEILVSQDQGDDMALLDHEANIIWTAKASKNDAIGLPGFADFDEDGDVEIYYRNEVVDAATGNILIAGTNSDWERDFTHGSLAVDVLPDDACADCAGLELVSGNEIWAINEAAGTRVLVRDMDDDIHANIDPNLNYYPKYYPNWDDQWSSVSAADYNLDGSMDLIITGALGTSSETYTGETTVFMWDVVGENVITFHDPSNNFVRGAGRVNIGDVDGDGQLNANFVMNQKLYSLDEDFNIHWIRPIKEGSSGFTGCSLFDFDGDGAVEVTYRSEESLLIIDGIGNGDNTTNIRREIACVSRTQEEYPVIADVDGDGASEICLACYTNNSTPFNPYSNTEFAQVRVYESDGESWMPARGVWNQHAYYNVNVNDDLTIPIEVQDHTRVFSDGLCEYADGSLVPFPSRPLNSFINQAPILNEDGCVEFASPDIEFVGILDASDAECPDATIEVTYEVRNIGDIAISGNLPVSYYAGDPRLADGSMLLDTEVTTLVNFEPETTLEITQTINGIGGEFQLFVVINDNGSTPPITVPLPTATIPECNTENNIQSTSVGFTRFDLVAEKLNDNRKCDDSLPDNGSAQAYYFGVVPGESGTIWVENFEDRPNSAKEDMDETAWTSDPGTESPSFYGVDNYNGSKMFSAVRTGGANDAGEVTWTSEAIDISDHTDLTVTLDLFESGKQERSGKWRDYIIASYELRNNDNVVTASGELTNGRHFGNFDYAQAILTGINNAGQNDSLLTISVVVHNTSTSELHFVDNVSVSGTPIPVPTIQTEADGFVFNWYNAGDTTNIIYSGSTFPQLAEGDYIVEGYYGPTFCFSALDTITIDRVRPEVFVWSYEVSQQTRCINPDGAAFAFAYTTTQDGSLPPATLSNPPGDTLLESDGYEVTWTRASDLFNTTIGVGNLLENRRGDTYRYSILDLFTGCVGDSTQLINSTAEAVTGLNMSADNITTCGGTGEVSADVNGNTSDYTFEWYNGAGIKPSVDFEGPVYTVNEPGYYTVIATDNTTGCQSPIDSILVVDEANAPVLSANATQANTTCGANPTGVAQAEVNGSVGPSGFEYTWFDGANTLPENEIPDPGNNTASFGVGEWEMVNLSAGIYTIIVEETATNCTDTTTVQIVDDIVDPVFTIGDVAIIPNTSCNGSNGSIDAGDAITPAANYTFSLYTGFVVDPGSFVESNSTGSFAGLSPDSYTISAVNIDTECPADPITVSVGNEPDNPIVDTTPTADEFCVDGNGQILVTSNSNVTEPGSYTYEIFRGFSFSNEITAISDITVSDGSTGHSFMGLSDGNYRIRVTNDNLGCDTFEDVVVGDASTVPVISTNRLVNDNTSCDTNNPNGTITVSIDTVGFDADNYTWQWYEGDAVLANKLLSTPSTDDVSVIANNYTIDRNVITGLPAGDYTIFARDNNTGCETVELTLTLADDPYIPNVVIVEEAPQTDCEDGNGILRAYVVDPDLPCTECIESDGFSFQWQYNGVDIVDGDPLSNGSDNITGSQSNTISGLVADQYTVIVTETNTTCDASKAFTLSEDQHIPIITGTPTADTSCDPVSATGAIDITVTNLDVDRTYTYEYTYSDTSPVINNATVNGSTTANLTGVIADTYTVIATSDLGCASDPITVVVPSNPNRPAFEAAALNAGTENNTVCDPRLSTISTFTGSVQVDVTDGSNLANYTINWFDGAGTSTPANTGVVDGNRYEELPGGTYTAQIISSIGNQCDTTIQIQIINETDDAFTNFDLDGDVTKTDDNSCISDNGELVVPDINSFGGSGNYNFKYYIGESVLETATDSININSNGVVFSGLAPGDYTVVIVDNETGCSTLPNTYTILEIPVTFTPALTKESDQTSCDLNNPNGQLAVDFGSFNLGTSNGTVSSDFLYQWFSGQNTNPTNEITTGLNADSSVVSGLASGIYTLQVTDRESGCTEIVEETVISDNNDPSFSLDAIEAATRCDNPNGEINFTLSSNPGTIAPFDGSDGFEVELFEGPTIEIGEIPIDNTTINDGDPGSFTGLAEGIYSIRARDISTNCSVESLNISVGYTGPSIADPDPTLMNNNQLSTTCFTSDGRIRIGNAINNISSGYTDDIVITWFVGNDTSDVNRTIANQLGNPPSDFGNVDVLNLDGDPVTIVNGEVDNLPAVSYTGVIELSNGCKYVIETELSIFDAPTIVTSVSQPLTRCADPKDGEISFTINPEDGISADQYEYFVFEGNVIIAPNTDPDGPFTPSLDDAMYGTPIARNFFTNSDTDDADNDETITIVQLDSGTYTIAVRERDVDGCITNVQTITIAPPDLTELSLDETNTSNNTICSTPNTDGNFFNGQISIDVTNPNEAIGDFSLQWFYDADGDGDFSTGSTAIVAGADGAGNGSFVEFDPTPSVNIRGLGEGWYRVIATGNSTACPDILDIELFNEPVALSINSADTSRLDIDDCNEQGSFAINAIRQDGLITAYASTADIEAGFDIAWTTLPAGYSDPGNVASANDLIEGDYIIFFTENSTGCTLEYSFSIEDTAELPTVRSTSRDDDSYCSPFGTEFRGDGSLTIEVEDNDSSTPGDFNITWYRGAVVGTNPIYDGGPNTGTTLAAANTDSLQLTGLSAGQYTVRVTKSVSPNNTCERVTTFTISSNPPTLSVALGDIDATDNFNCENPNGIITIENILVDGSTFTDDPLNYSFDWEILEGSSFETFDDGVDGTIESASSFNGNRINDLFGGTYRVTINNTVTGCATGTIEIEIEDNQVNPSVALEGKTPDEFCYDDNQGNGTLSINIFDNISGILTQVDNPTSADYIVEWYRGGSVTNPTDAAFLFDNQGNANLDAMVIGDAAINGDISELTGLSNGQYTVGITKVNAVSPNAGCDIVGTFSIESGEVIPTLDENAIQLRTLADTLCGAFSGTIILSDTDVDPGVLTDYNFTITGASTGLVDLTLFPITEPWNITDLAPDDYSIVATNATTGCEAAVGFVNVPDEVTNPLVTLERLIPDENCGAGATNAGVIEVLVDGVYDHTNQSFLTFSWTGATIPVGVETDQALLDSIPEGDYEITVTNTNTNCAITRMYTVPNISIVPIITQTQINDNTNCTPSIGSYELVEVTYADVVYTDGGVNDLNGVFELEVFRSTDNGSEELVSSSPYIIDSLSANDYYAIVRHIATNCTAEQVDFTIEDSPEIPNLILTLNAADSTCTTGFSHNGTVTALANDQDHTNTDYTFQWYFGAAADIGGSAILLDGTALPNGSLPVGFNESTISGLAAGTYSVQVSQASNGCVVSEEIAIPNIPAEIEIVSVDVTSSTDCNGNGVIEITEVLKNGLSDDLSNYTFAFYTPNLEPGNLVFTTDPAVGPIFDAAMGGTTYFIVGTHISFGCTTTPVFQTEVLEDVVRPVIDLTDFDRQSNCDPDNPNGTLTVLADGQPENATYDFQWYYGTNTADSLSSDDYTGGENLAGEQTNAVSGLRNGFYTVEVLNNTTGCTATETFEMVDDTPDEFALSTSVSPNTSCSEPNGRVAASVLNPIIDEDTGEFREYIFYWFLDPNAAFAENVINANFIGSSIENLPQGNYYVLAVDATDGFCNSVVERVEVLDQLTPPMFEVEKNDVTVCFEEKDGYAEVIIDDLSAVTITWRDDMNDSIGSTFFIDSLDAGLYSVEVVDNISQCSNEIVVEIFNNAETPNAPFVLVNNVRNNCLLTNGSAIANVDGVTNNFLFEWFDPIDLNTPYATGASVSNLDSITYLVRATDITTGCESPFTQVDIGFEEIVPEFTVIVDNSICLRTEDGATNQFTGSAFIQFAEFNLPSVVEWTFLETNEVVSTDARLIDAFPGDYRVRVVAENGCEYFREFSIEVTLNIYNGVSSNGDGKNDFFLIDCIDYFPANNVKIFNRAGQRIYEVDGYDNRNVRFEGVSNVGGGGLVLPSGTYFYLVDLGTGADPIQGYLELVR